MKKIFFIATLIILSVFSFVNAFGNDKKEWEIKIDTLAQGVVKRNKLPSIQIAVGHKGKIIFENSYGVNDLIANKQATLSTQYRTASISKWFTGTATMKLVEKGLINLDLPIQNYCPEYSEKPWPITTRQLLSHTAGIRHYMDFNSLRHQAGSDEELVKIEALIAITEKSYQTHYTDVLAPLEAFKDDDLIFEPGTRHRYSSFGFRVLGCVIRGATGAPYREFMQQAVFDTAGMTHTIEEDRVHISEFAATGYQFNQAGMPELAPARDISENIPAGGHLSTASDLIKFAIAFDMGDLVGSSSVDLMSSLPKNNDGEDIGYAGYGHGVDFIGSFPGSLGHGGTQEGTTTLLILLPEENISIAVMTNVSGWRNINGFTQKILEHVRSGIK